MNYSEKNKSYLFDLNTREGMRLYYACKERFGESLENRSEFILKIINEIKENFKTKKTVLIPESSNDFIEKIASGLGKEVIIIRKNSKEKILENIDSLNLQKKEKNSHLQRISEMKGAFKINSLKANPRRKYQNLLFEKVEIIDPNTSIILDDSCFSGTTKNALIEATGVSDFFFIFSK